MAKLTPEQEARYALDYGVRREDLPRAAQFEYDRLKPDWDAAAAQARARVRAEAALSQQALAEECAKAWREFGQQPGVHMWWVRAGAARRELRTADQQTIASLRYGRPTTLSAGGRTFTWKRVRVLAAPTGPKTMELLDQRRMPVLSANGWDFGRGFARGAAPCITFPDQRELRFWVKGTKRANAIMTAVDGGGNKIARYRITRPGSLARGQVEIAVHPDRELTDELALAIAISAPWVSGYFAEPVAESLRLILRMLGS